MLYAGVNGLIDDVPVADVRTFFKGLLEQMSREKKTLLETIAKEITKDAEVELKAVIASYRERKGFAAQV